MKKLLLILPLALILCFMVSCQDKEAMAELEEFKAQAALEEQNIKNVYLAVELWNTDKLELAEQVYADNCVAHVGGESFPFGPNEAKQAISFWKRSFPDFKFNIEDIIAKGDKVTVRVVFTGTHQGEFNGISPTGNKIKVSQTGIERFENGKKVEFWEDWDQLGMLQQLGMELKPKEEK